MLFHSSISKMYQGERQMAMMNKKQQHNHHQHHSSSSNSNSDDVNVNYPPVQFLGWKSAGTQIWARLKVEYEIYLQFLQSRI